MSARVITRSQVGGSDVSPFLDVPPGQHHFGHNVGLILLLDVVDDVRLVVR